MKSPYLNLLRRVRSLANQKGKAAELKKARAELRAMRARTSPEVVALALAVMRVKNPGSRSKAAGKSLRAPTSLAMLGTVLDVRIEEGTRRWTQRFPRFLLCSDPQKRVLWLIPKPAQRKSVPLEGLGDAGDVYRAWSSFAPIGAFSTRAKVSTPRKVGRVVAIGYRSDKWSGSPESYEHVFRQLPLLEQCGNVFRIRGPSVRVTPRGITG